MHHEVKNERTRLSLALDKRLLRSRRAAWRALLIGDSGSMTSLSLKKGRSMTVEAVILERSDLTVLDTRAMPWGSTPANPVWRRRSRVMRTAIL
jgi:hypothetical protein